GSSVLLLARAGIGGGGVVALIAWTTIAAASAPVPTIAIETAVTEAAAFVAVAVAVGLAHHRGGAFLEFGDPHSQCAQHVFVDPLLPLDLCHRGGGRINVEKGEMRLAVLADAVAQGFDAPVFVLGDFAAHLLDDALVLGGQFLHLLRGEIRARQKDVFVKRHDCPFLSRAKPAPAPSPSCPSGKARKREGGNTGRRAISPCPMGPNWGPWGRPFSSRPGSSGSGGYKGFTVDCK